MSREKRYTPGPWHPEMNCCHTGQVATCHGDGPGYWEVWTTKWGDGVDQKANAHIIAAAPDLLEALEEAIQWAPLEPMSCQGRKCSDPWCEWCCGEESASETITEVEEALQRCRAAIAKAYGETE